MKKNKKNQWHLIDTKLPPSDWYDTDTKMLHGMMELCVDFVEKESTGEYMPFSLSNNKNRNKNIKKEWKKIDNVKDPHLKKMEKSIFESQIKSDNEIMKIYKWWKDYPRRRREIDNAITYWYTFCMKFKKKDSLFPFPNTKVMNKKEIRDEKALRRITHILEAKLAKEETEYLIRLVKVRKYMWT